MQNNNNKKISIDTQEISDEEIIKVFDKLTPEDIETVKTLDTYDLQDDFINDEISDDEDIIPIKTKRVSTVAKMRVSPVDHKRKFTESKQEVYTIGNTSYYLTNGKPSKTTFKDLFAYAEKIHLELKETKKALEKEKKKNNLAKQPIAGNNFNNDIKEIKEKIFNQTDNLLDIIRDEQISNMNDIIEKFDGLYRILDVPVNEEEEEEIKEKEHKLLSIGEQFQLLDTRIEGKFINFAATIKNRCFDHNFGDLESLITTEFKAQEMKNAAYLTNVGLNIEDAILKKINSFESNVEKSMKNILQSKQSQMIVSTDECSNCNSLYKELAEAQRKLISLLTK